MIKQNDAIEIAKKIKHDAYMDTDWGGDILDKWCDKIITELERAKRMQKTLMQISNYPYVDGVCGKNIRIIAKQALSDAPTIKPQYGEWRETRGILKDLPDAPKEGK